MWSQRRRVGDGERRVGAVWVVVAVAVDVRVVDLELRVDALDIEDARVLACHQRGGSGEASEVASW